jgi:6-phosphogluconolactonase
MFHPLRTLVLLLVAMTASAQTVYFGNYADAIHAADFDTNTGKLSHDRPVTPLKGASFLAKSTDGRRLYAVAESGKGGLFALAIQPDGTLTELNSRPSEGGGPCAIALSPDGRLVAAANYSGGSVIVYHVAADGSLGDKSAFFQHAHATGVFPGRQKAPHAHGVTWSPDGRLLLVPDLGGDRVYLYACDAATGTLQANSAQPWLETSPGAGPRHTEFSPDARHLYVINELGNTVTVAAYDAAAGTFTVVETVSTLPPEGSPIYSKTAEIALTPDGRTLYASNRGHDTLAVFTRDPATGRLTARGHVAVPANPRHFALSPDGRWLLSAGQDTGTVATFVIDPFNGDLTPAGEPFATPKPVCIRF